MENQEKKARVSGALASLLTAALHCLAEPPLPQFWALCLGYSLDIGEVGLAHVRLQCWEKDNLKTAQNTTFDTL